MSFKFSCGSQTIDWNLFCYVIFGSERNLFKTNTLKIAIIPCLAREHFKKPANYTKTMYDCRNHANPWEKLRKLCLFRIIADFVTEFYVCILCTVHTCTKSHNPPRAQTVNTDYCNATRCGARSNEASL